MSLIQWYADALNRADNDKHIDRSMLRTMVLLMVGLLTIVPLILAMILLIVWKWWLGVPLAAYAVYRAVLWAVTEPEETP